MDSKKAIKNISTLLVEGRYFELMGQAITDLKASSLNNELIDGHFLTSSLVFAGGGCDYIARDLRQKGITGQNASGEVLEARLAQAQQFVDSIKNKCTIEDIKAKADQYPLFADDKMKAYFKESLDTLNPAVEDSALASVIATAVLAKVTGAFDKDTTIDYEMSLEPLAIALIEDKGKLTRSYVDKKLSITTLKAQVIKIANAALASEGRDEKGASKYFHDLSVTTYISTLIDKLDEQSIGITPDSVKPMFYVDENGTPKRFISSDAKYISDKNICDLLLQKDKDGYFSAIRKIQGQILGSDNFDAETGAIKNASQFANPKKVAKLLMELAFIADGLGEEIDEKFAFAVINPLIEEVHSIKYKDQVDEIVADALLDAQLILQTEKDIEYSPVVKKADGEESKRSLPKIIKKNSTEIKLAVIEKVIKGIGKTIKLQYDAHIGELQIKLASAIKDLKTAEEDASIPEKSKEGFTDNVSSLEKRVTAATDAKSVATQLENDIKKRNNQNYIKFRLGLIDSETPLEIAAGTQTQEEIEKIIEILKPLKFAAFEGSLSDYNSMINNVYEKIEDDIKAIVANMPTSTKQLADRAADRLPANRKKRKVVQDEAESE